MNRIQKKILIIAAAFVTIMLLFPPYVEVRSGNVISSGYGFLLDLPNRATVDVATLIIQWIGVAIVSAALFVLVKDK